MRGALGVIVLVWLLIGVFAAYQRSYDFAETRSRRVSTVRVDIHPLIRIFHPIEQHPIPALGMPPWIVPSPKVRIWT